MFDASGGFCFDKKILVFRNNIYHLYIAVPERMQNQIYRIFLVSSLAIPYYKLGNIYKAKKEINAAKDRYQQAKNIWERLIIISSQMAEYKRNLNFINSRLSKI
jgi:hypothetical protein